jgi:hypothetical protein
MKKLKGIDGKLDIAWSRLVKLRAGGKCEYKNCNKTKPLNSHHIFSRSNRSVRWDVDNGICLCVGHHTFGLDSAHKNPTGFTMWLIETKGQEFVDELMQKAHQTVKLHKHEKEDLLDKLNEEIKKYEK